MYEEEEKTDDVVSQEEEQEVEVERQKDKPKEQEEKKSDVRTVYDEETGTWVEVDIDEVLKSHIRQKNLEEKTKKSKHRQAIEEEKQRQSDLLKTLGLQHEQPKNYAPQQPQENTPDLYQPLDLPEDPQLPQMPTIFQGLPQEMQKFEEGGKKTVSQLWEEKTGKSWSEAKNSGLTDGSYEQNMTLMNKLQNQEVQQQNQQIKTYNVNNEVAQPKNFNEAFKIAREQLGPNKIFEFQGRKYGTNLQGETFQPSKEELSRFGMDDSKTLKRLKEENNNVVSPYVSKNTVKLEQDQWKPWEEVKKRNAEINKKSNAEKIIEYKKQDKGVQNYAIVDKSKGLLHIYTPQGDLLFTSAVDLGEVKGDAQTTTKIINGKVDFSKGNKQTGAGKFYISNINPTGYKGLPSFNMMNEKQYHEYSKTGTLNSVSTTIHSGYIADDQNRVSNGCIRCNKTTLENLTKNLKNLSEVYILPEDEGNQFVFENGKLNFKVKDSSKYQEYTDKQGEKQKGQGINRSENTLQYFPLKIEIDKSKFQKDVFQALDFSDDKEYKNVEKFVSSLANNKKAIMKAAKINGDVYNEIAKMSFGIMGAESNWGDTHTAVGNLGRAVSKYFDPSGSSSPDYKSKYETYGAKGKNRSVGFTQLRWGQLNDAELKALKEVGVTSNKQFMDPKYSAIATATVLGVRYNEQLNSSQKQDLWKYLPKTWNTRSNYADRVKENSKYVTLYQSTSPNKVPPKTIGQEYSWSNSSTNRK